MVTTVYSEGASCGWTSRLQRAAQLPRAGVRLTLCGALGAKPQTWGPGLQGRTQLPPAPQSTRVSPDLPPRGCEALVNISAAASIPSPRSPARSAECVCPSTQTASWGAAAACCSRPGT